MDGRVDGWDETAFSQVNTCVRACDRERKGRTGAEMIDTGLEPAHKNLLECYRVNIHDNNFKQVGR